MAFARRAPFGGTAKAGGVILDGGAELEMTLRSLSRKMHSEVLTKAVRYAVKPVMMDAKRLVTIDHGTLKKSIKTKTKKYRTTTIAIVGPDIRVKDESTGEVPANIAHLVEFGTAPHRLGKGARLAPRGKRGRVLAGGPKHPGATAKPFLRPAFDANTENMVKRFRDKILIVLMQYTKKQGAK